MFKHLALCLIAASLSACGPSGGVASAGSTPAESHASTGTAPAAQTPADISFVERVTAAATWYGIAAAAYRAGDGAAYSAAMAQGSAALAGIVPPP